MMSYGLSYDDDYRQQHEYEVSPEIDIERRYHNAEGILRIQVSQMRKRDPVGSLYQTPKYLFFMHTDICIHHSIEFPGAQM